MTKDDKAKQIFKKELDDGILILADGTRYLGAPLGSEGFKRKFFKEKMSSINKKITKLENLSRTSPHSAYHLYTRSVKHEITYLQRVGLNEEETDETSKSIMKLVEAMIGRKIRDQSTWSEISNPARHGGLGMNVARLREETKEKRDECKVTRAN